jgi:hypothetical protein
MFQTKTSIVNRKTTFIQSSNLDLNTPSDTDSDSSVIMSNRKRKNKVNKTIVARSQRKCEQCKIEVKSGVDMYKIYRTGVTVCKQCWITIDPGKTKTPSKKRKKIDYSETKLCSVLLEDVYQKNPNEREYKIEKDDKGNTVFIVTDDSESESRTKRKINVTKSNDVDNKQYEIKENIHDVEIKKTKSARGTKRKEEIVENKPIRSGSKRKESEQSLQEFEVKSTRSRRHKESEHTIREEVEKPSKSNSKRKDSEGSIQDDGEDVFPRDSVTFMGNEQNIQENIETKNIRITRRRKESEESSQDVEIRFTRSSRIRKDSEQSIQEIFETKPTRSLRQRKESDQSIQEYERKSMRNNKNRKDSEQSLQEYDIKSTRNNKNRRDSEQSSQESIEIISARGLRRRKVSDQSAQEDIEVNVDIDSDSAPVLKKAKTARSKVESIPKQIQLNINNQNNTGSEIVFTQKRGRSSSIESTDSIRKSTRTARKNASELEEIIEIDVDDSNSFKPQKENVLVNERTLTHESKRNRIDRSVSCENHSDVESNASDRKINSKRSSSVSSKESTPVLQFKTPHNKDNQENLESLKFTLKETRSSRFIKIQKSEIGKPDDVESLKSIEVDTSESEEIDVLKSTDEETKDDTLEMEAEEKDKSKSPALEDDLKSDKEIIGLVDDDITTSVDEDNSKSTEENIDITTNDAIGKTQNAANEKISIFNNKEINKVENRRDYKLIKQDVIGYEKEKYSRKSENDSIEVIITNMDKKKIVEEVLNEVGKEIIVADVNYIETNLSEDYSDHSMSEFIKEKFTSSKQLLSNKSKSRKSKISSIKKSKKSRNKDSSDDIIVYDSSDSEAMKITEQINATYTCTICDKIYENKFIGLQHELTHMKTLEIKLKKIQIPETNKSFNESDIELEISSKDNTIHSDSTGEIIAIDQNEEKSANTLKNKEQVLEKGKRENNLTMDKKEEIINEQNIIKEFSIKNSNIDIVERNNDEEIYNELSQIQESIEESRKDKGIERIYDSTEEKVQYVENLLENEVEGFSRRSMRRLTKKSEIKNDRKSRGKRKPIHDNIELEEEIATEIETESDKIAEAVQETLNDMAELHVKIQESNPVKVPELNIIVKGNEPEIEKKNGIAELNIDNENQNEIKIMHPTEENECSGIVECEDVIQKEISQSEEEVTYETANDMQEIENESESSKLGIPNKLSNDALGIEIEATKQAQETIINKPDKIENNAAELIKTVTNVANQLADIAENVECKLSKPTNADEIEETADSNESSDHENESIIDSPIGLNVETGVEINMTVSDRPDLEKLDDNLDKDNEATDIMNEVDDNNTEDEEALAQESLEELMQRGGLQIIDELAESVTDGDEESEKDVNLSSEKENLPEKEVELDNELQIKISDAECTEILEISSKSLSKQKEVDSDVLGENQIIQDVDVVEEVVNDDEQPHGNVIQEVEVESNGNCVNVANNVVGQVLTDVFDMATVDVTKRLDLQTEPISDEETDIIPETVENISREIRNSQDMPSLDPIDEVNDD